MPLLAWEAPALPSHTRTTRWYLVGAGLVLGCAVYGILTKNWIFALVVLLTGGVYGWLRNKPPLLHRIGIREDGFSYDDVFTPWEQCKDYFFLRTPDFTELHFVRLRGGWSKETVIQTGSVDVVRIRETLEPYLDERKDQREPMLHALARFLKL